MERKINFRVRDLLFVIIGVAIGIWFSTLRDLHAQVPPQHISAQGCGDWVIQTFQASGVGYADYAAYVLNTRSGEVFFLKNDKKLSAKEEKQK